MKSLLVSLSIAASLLGAPVFAADMAFKAPAAPAAPAWTWTGFYVGLNAGDAWGRTVATDMVATLGGCWAGCGATFSTNTHGFTGGGQIGYNWQAGIFVLGLEADVGSLGLKGTGPYLLLPSTFVQTNGRLFTTVRGRVGLVAANNWLLYITGGYFGADFHSTVGTTPAAPVQLLNVSKTGFQDWVTIGGGVEYAFLNHWSLKAEYLRYEVAKKIVGGNFFGGGANIQLFGIDNGSGNLVRAGLNYHFN